MNDYDVQMDDEEETKSVNYNMSQLRDNNAMANQSHNGPENTQYDGPVIGTNDAMDRLLSARKSSPRTLSVLEAERRRLSSQGSKISQRRISQEKDKIKIIVDGTPLD